jgi:hypothetical protein
MLAPAMGELVLNAGVVTAGSGFLFNQFKHFEEPIKNLVTEEIGKLCQRSSLLIN